MYVCVSNIVVVVVVGLNVSQLNFQTSDGESHNLRLGSRHAHPAAQSRSLCRRTEKVWKQKRFVCLDYSQCTQTFLSVLCIHTIIVVLQFVNNWMYNCLIHRKMFSFSVEKCLNKLRYVVPVCVHIPL